MSYGPATGVRTRETKRFWRVQGGSNEFFVTLDKDFGELVAVHRTAHSGIVRLVNFAARVRCRALLRVLEEYGVELSHGAILTVEPGSVR
jgi:predicted nuclease of predicted toxin-antitoxin system